MKKSTPNEVLINSICAQIYSRLTLAASQGLFVYWADLSPILFGAQFDKVADEQSDTLWKMLALTIEMDAAAGRPPLAALFVSRKNGRRKPMTPFFVTYETHYHKPLDEAGWDALVIHIWQTYRIPPSALERLS